MTTRLNKDYIGNWVERKARKDVVEHHGLYERLLQGLAIITDWKRAVFRIQPTVGVRVAEDKRGT